MQKKELEVEIISRSILNSMEENHAHGISEETFLKFFDLITKVIDNPEIFENEVFIELATQVYMAYAYEDTFAENDDINMAFCTGALWGALGVLDAHIINQIELQNDIVRKELLSSEYKDILKTIAEEKYIYEKNLAQTVNMDEFELNKKMIAIENFGMHSVVHLGESKLYCKTSILERIIEENEKQSGKTLQKTRDLN